MCENVGIDYDSGRSRGPAGPAAPASALAAVACRCCHWPVAPAELTRPRTAEARDSPGRLPRRYPWGRLSLALSAFLYLPLLSQPGLVLTFSLHLATGRGGGPAPSAYFPGFRIFLLFPIFREPVPEIWRRDPLGACPASAAITDWATHPGASQAGARSLSVASGRASDLRDGRFRLPSCSFLEHVAS